MGQRRLLWQQVLQLVRILTKPFTREPLRISKIRLTSTHISSRGQQHTLSAPELKSMSSFIPALPVKIKLHNQTKIYALNHTQMIRTIYTKINNEHTLFQGAVVDRACKDEYVMKTKNCSSSQASIHIPTRTNVRTGFRS